MNKGEQVIKTPAYNGAVTFVTRVRTAATDLLAQQIIKTVDIGEGDEEDTEYLIRENMRYHYALVASCTVDLEVDPEFPYQPNGIVKAMQKPETWQSGYEEFLSVPGEFNDEWIAACSESVFSHLLAPRFRNTPADQKKDAPTGSESSAAPTDAPGK